MFQAFLTSIQGDFSSVLYPLLIYYVSGCPQIDVVQTDVVPLADLTLQVLTEADAVLANITAAVPEISAVCGTDPTSLRILLSEVSRLLCLTADTVLDTIDFFTCSNWNGLYSSVMYTAVCYNGNTGFGWIAATQTVILMCSLVFLTLRVAFYELVDESEIDESRSSPCPGCLHLLRSGGFCLHSCRSTGGHCDKVQSPTQPTNELLALADQSTKISEWGLLARADQSTARAECDRASNRSRTTSNGSNIKSRTILSGSPCLHGSSDHDTREFE